MTKKATERERFVAIMTKELPAVRVDDLGELMRLARHEAMKITMNVAITPMQNAVSRLRGVTCTWMTTPRESPAK